MRVLTRLRHFHHCGQCGRYFRCTTFQSDSFLRGLTCRVCPNCRRLERTEGVLSRTFRVRIAWWLDFLLGR